MTSTFNFLVILLILLNFRLLSSSRLTPCIHILMMQAVILTCVTWLTHQSNMDIRLMILLGVNIALKAIAMPWMLSRVAHKTAISRELDPIVGYTASLIIGAFLLGFSVLISRPLYLSHTVVETLFLPVSLFTMFSGLFMTIARKKAITQVLGYMVMENGIYTFGMAMAIQEPFIVELSVLLDVFVAVLIMGVAIFHISREFDHMDTDRLSVLRDL
ncbi:HyfE [Desulforapulum autotrophicum HRM2]|jgi:hydrogenase-4 component E|uniref:HyfE n=1 Tax=Desulforapulum autotrophicum (strain ATCC 43914 / DSM 3382 / VKM B-1955 / HRM2) TaxID=177437 RepID=C0QBF5_DESAH|nr:NADH-quinone oxidoreductase subunit K [Desulforapulum autotrophicum]ACN16957.1 HyfE [Desulforapulum autotrophicum HRM2]